MGDCIEGVANPFSLRLDFLVRKRVYGLDLLDGAASARSHATTSARGLPYPGSRRGERAQKRAVRIRDQECGN